MNSLYALHDIWWGFNLFRYITFRTGGAILTSLVISFCVGPALIRWLKKKQKEGQPIRNDGPISHLATKKGTPTMGGCLILLAVGLSTLLWADLHNPYIGLAMGVTFCLGALGAIDDSRKLMRRNHKGVSGRFKLTVQSAVAGLAACGIMMVTPASLADGLMVPVLKDVCIHLGILFIPWAMFVMVGTSNAVNLTDGLDGLAIVPVMIAAACLAFISYLVGHSVFAQYLHIPFVPGVGELSVFLGAWVGAGLGFLWFNAPPARVFMGDTGSLAAGGALGSVAVMIKHEIVLAIIGGLFVMEALSVIIQVAYFKRTGRRIFLMAPIHHHFEKKGWSEPTIVIRFWIIASILALIGLSTLKLR